VDESQPRCLADTRRFLKVGCSGSAHVFTTLHHDIGHCRSKSWRLSFTLSITYFPLFPVTPIVVDELRVLQYVKWALMTVDNYTLTTNYEHTIPNCRSDSIDADPACPTYHLGNITKLQPAKHSHVRPPFTRSYAAPRTSTPLASS